MKLSKIAILKAGGIGDFVAALPAITALKETFPEAEIILLAAPYHAELLQGRPSPVDRVEIVPAYNGVRKGDENKEEIEEFIERMRKEKFDLAVQLHGGGKNSNPFIKLLGAKKTLGYKTEDAEPLDINLVYRFYQNEVARGLELVAKIGAKTTNLLPKIEVVPSDVKEANELLNLPDKYVVIHPGASEEKRRWPAERFAKLADEIAQMGYQVVITGTSVEKQNIDVMTSNLKSKPIVALDKLSLGGMLGLLSKANLVVSNDTGPMHLATAVGAPTVGIMWAGNMVNWAYLGREKYIPVPSWITHCPKCGASVTTDERIENGCDHNANYAAGATYEDVLKAVVKLL